ncbi:MAG TPA: C45 family autoproteolytic acyltransferase/hydrolase [Terriglobia bacterium]|nr:C45 family autoproteolytic acyltransferase/hydrolase [Terriglobia bacterium]
MKNKQTMLRLGVVAGFAVLASALMAFRSGSVEAGALCAPLPNFPCDAGRAGAASPVLLGSAAPMVPADMANAATSAPPRAPGGTSADMANAATSGPSKSPANAKGQESDPRLHGAYRFEQGGWIYVHLEGTPGNVGFQHGYLLAPEIADAFAAIKLTETHTTKRDWDFFRAAARDMLWPHIEPEYQQELTGITEGVKARGVQMDVYDVVALNAFEELPDYYVPWYNAQHKVAGAPRLATQGNCSAFVATGSYTKDRQIVIAHNNWTNFIEGERWRIIFDIAPEHGYRILMDGFPGVIASDDDFGINSDGLMITETTITQFHGWNPNGIPEFERARKALQYSTSIDDYVRIMLDGNNGGYANDWLLGDRKTGEIAQFELGLKDYRVWRTKDGYYVGSNFTSDPKLTKEETTFDPNNPETSPNARHISWDRLMQQYKGQIDVAMAQKFEADHYDSYEKKEHADARTLCGHGESDARGVPIWDWGPYYPGGAVQGKATDSAMAEAMTLVARAGHPCGTDFIAADFLKAHPQYNWMAPALRDMKAGPWTEFKSGEKASGQ